MSERKECVVPGCERPGMIAAGRAAPSVAVYLCAEHHHERSRNGGLIRVGSGEGPAGVEYFAWPHLTPSQRPRCVLTSPVLGSPWCADETHPVYRRRLKPDEVAWHWACAVEWPQEVDLDA